MHTFKPSRLALGLLARNNMFCPECGALSFPDSKGWIKCPDYKCGYNGPLDNKMKDPVTGQEIDLGNVQSSSKAQTRKFEVIDDKDQAHGVLTSGSYICPKCDGQDVFSELRQTRASDEPETRLLTCKNCKHGWREY